MNTTSLHGQDACPHATPEATVPTTTLMARSLGGCRDTASLALAHLIQLRLILLVSLLAGIALPVLVAPRHRWTVALVVAVTIAYSTALALGVRLLRDTQQLSFYYSRAIPTAALWWGSFLASVLASLLMGLAVLAPTSALGLLGLARAEAGSESLWLAAAVPLAVLLAHVFISLAESRTGWRFLGAPLALSAGALFFFAFSSLSTVLDLRPAVTVFGKGTPAQAVVALVFAITLHLGLLIGATLRTTRGRLDSRRGHRALATALWGSLLLGGAASVALAHAILSPDLPDQEIVHLEVTPGDTQPWIAVAAADLTPGWLGKLRWQYGSWYAVNTETGDYRRLEHLVRRPPFRRNAIAFTRSGTAVFWPTGDRKDLLLASLDLDRPDLDGQEPIETRDPLTFGATEGWWVSPDAKVVIDLWKEWIRIPGSSPTESVVVQATELGTERTVARLDILTESTGASWWPRPKGVPGTSSFEWSSNTVAEIEFANTTGNLARIRFDASNSSINATALVRLDPAFLAATSADPTNPESAVFPSYLAPQWQDGGTELWVATGPRIQVYAGVHSTDLQAPTRTIYTAPSGDQVRSYQRDGDRLLVLVGDPQTSTGEAVLLERRPLGDAPAADWQTVASLRLVPIPELQIRLDPNSYLLRSPEDPDTHQRATTVLGLRKGALVRLSAAQWLEKKGLPASGTIYPASGESSGELFYLDDGSLWHTAPSGGEPRKLNIPAPIKLNYRWRSWL